MGPDECKEDAESATDVAIFNVLTVEALIRSGTSLSPTRVPDTDVVNVTDGAVPSDPGANVENVKDPIPEDPGASADRDGSVSLLKITVRSAER